MDVSSALAARKLAGDLWASAALAAALADAEVWQLTRDATHAEVAVALGVSRSAVNKAITQHNRRAAALAGPESDK